VVVHIFPLEPLLQSGFIGVSTMLVKVVNEKKDDGYQYEYDDPVFIHDDYLLGAGQGATISISAFL
jgi:hypothetical protein